MRILLSDPIILALADEFGLLVLRQLSSALDGVGLTIMYCHGELARSRPHPSRLTHFYLAVSAGGVVGGALVALGAPALLRGYFEVEIGFVLLAGAVLWRSWKLPPDTITPSSAAVAPAKTSGLSVTALASRSRTSAAWRSWSRQAPTTCGWQRRL